jgi:outer membrane protein OmpA-like peptidoglycan-associated protein
MAKNKKEIKEDEALLEAISPFVNELIDRNYKNSQEKIAKQMAPLIGSAIREQVKNQKDEVVDALYPVMGNMIGRYVTKTFEEILERINVQIQNGLSYKALKRKIRAKIQGISESELILQENIVSNIRALLLIHKETGVVLTIAQNPQKPLHEPEMLASMITAIQSFVNDWIEQNRKNQELAEIEFGESRIIIENGGYAFLAVIVDGVASKKIYEDIRKVMASILLENGDEIRNFNGDLTKFSNINIYKQISSLLSDNKEKDNNKKVHPLLYLIPIIFVIFLGWYLYNENIKENRLKEVKEVLKSTPQLALYNIKSKLDNDKLILKGEVPSLYHKQLALKRLKSLKGIKNIENNLVVVDFKTPKQIEANIFYLIKGFNLSNNALLDYSYKYPILTINGNFTNKEEKEKLIAELKKIEGVDEIVDNTMVKIPKIKTIVYFKIGSYIIEDEQKIKLDKVATILKSLDKNKTVVVDGYSDFKGLKSFNEKIAKKRAIAVEKYLKEVCKIPQKIKINKTAIISKETDMAKELKVPRCAVVSLSK